MLDILRVEFRRQPKLVHCHLSPHTPTRCTWSLRVCESQTAAKREVLYPPPCPRTPNADFGRRSFWRGREERGVCVVWCLFLLQSLSEISHSSCLTAALLCSSFLLGPTTRRPHTPHRTEEDRRPDPPGTAEPQQAHRRPCHPCRRYHLCRRRRPAAASSTRKGGRRTRWSW